MEGGPVHTQTLRLLALAFAVLAEGCLMATLISMEGEDVSVDIPGPTDGPVQINFTFSVSPCWNWKEDASSQHQDCALDLVFTSILVTALVSFILLLSALTFHLKRRSALDLDCCVNPVTQSTCWSFLEHFLPLFGLVITLVLVVVFVAIVFNDGRSEPSLPDWLNLRHLMVDRKPWRIGLTIAALFFLLLSCIPAGRLAARWGDGGKGGYSHLQTHSSSRKRGRRARAARPTLKSALVFDSAQL